MARVMLLPSTPHYVPKPRAHWPGFMLNNTDPERLPWQFSAVISQGACEHMSVYKYIVSNPVPPIPRVYVYFPSVHTHNRVTFKSTTPALQSLSRRFFMCVFLCALIMAPSGLRLPLMQWRPTGVKQVQSGTWAPPINPFHCVKPNIIAWGAGGHGLPSVGWNGH